jgi:hypothetical protein
MKSNKSITLDGDIKGWRKLVQNGNGKNKATDERRFAQMIFDLCFICENLWLK